MVYPQFPECVGVFRAVERPTYDDLVNQQMVEARKSKGPGTLEELFAAEDTWVVE
jgi:2-oxoglutarate ferredoxin oxidoreductase subunit beta